MAGRAPSLGSTGTASGPSAGVADGGGLAVVEAFGEIDGEVDEAAIFVEEGMVSGIGAGVADECAGAVEAAGGGVVVELDREIGGDAVFPVLGVGDEFVAG